MWWDTCISLKGHRKHCWPIKAPKVLIDETGRYQVANSSQTRPIVKYLIFCSYFRDLCHVWNRGLNRGHAVALVSDLVKSSGQPWWWSSWSQKFFWLSQFFLRSTRLIFNRSYRVRSYCIITKRHTAHQICWSIVPFPTDRTTVGTYANSMT